MEANSLTIGEASIEGYRMLEARKTLWGWTAVKSYQRELRVLQVDGKQTDR